MDGQPYAMYYAHYTEAHPDGQVSAFIIIGKWDADALPMNRIAFGLHLVPKDSGFGVIVVDATDTPWGNTRQAGCKLTRINALKHPRLQEVYHITDHIFRDDRPIIEYLEKQRPAGPVAEQPS